MGHWLACGLPSENGSVLCESPCQCFGTLAENSLGAFRTSHGDITLSIIENPDPCRLVCSKTDLWPGKCPIRKEGPSRLAIELYDL